MIGSGAGRRFYIAAEAVETEGGWGVALDGRPIRAPSGRPLAAGRRVAAAAAEEWAAQLERIRPETMPVTRALNTAIDRVAPQRGAVIDSVAAYAGADLVCYRAETPEGLAQAEAAAWDPLLSWASERHGAALRAVRGVMHAPQPEPALAALKRAVAAQSDLGLTALHELTSLAGSLVIALAVRDGRLDAAEGWRLSRIDEDHQAALWGRDAEAEAAAAGGAAAFAAAARLGALDDADRAAEAAG